MISNVLMVNDENRVRTAVEKRTVFSLGLSQPPSVKPDAPNHIVKRICQLCDLVALLASVKTAIPANRQTFREGRPLSRPDASKGNRC